MRSDEKYFTDLIEEEALKRLPLFTTFCELLENCEKNFSEYPAISNMKETITYAQLCEAIAMRRDFLYSEGFKKGDHIAVLAPNSMYSMELYMAIPTAGCTVIMLPSAENALSHEDIEKLIKKFDIKGLFVNPEYEVLTKGLPTKVYDIRKTSTQKAPMAEVCGDDIAVICFSVNDDPANPYGAMLSHRAIMRAAHNGLFIPGRTFYQVTVAILPLSHVFGAIRGLLTCIYTGALVYACEDMSNIVFDIPKMKPTILTLVPGLAEMILSVAKIKGPQFLEGIETMICGGAYVQPKLVKLAEKLGINLLVGYGLTEASNIVTGNVKSAEYPDSVGKVYPGTEIEVRDGELLVKGDVVMSGYYKDEERTAEMFTEDGWLKTGDLAQIDENGYLHILGLRKDLIILPNGENICPRELEKYFAPIPGIKDCRVVEDELRGRPLLAIKINPDEEYFARREDTEVEKYFKTTVKEKSQTLPSYKMITKVIVTKETLNHEPSDRLIKIEWE